jgi:hypothetical protein
VLQAQRSLGGVVCESIIGGGTIARRLLLLEEVPNSVFQNNPRKVRNFIASLYTVAILALVLKRTFLASFVALLAQDAAAHNAASPITQSKKNTIQTHNSGSSSSTESVSVVRDSDKLRAFQPYWPATGKRSTIEGFETVDVL